MPLNLISRHTPRYRVAGADEAERNGEDSGCSGGRGIWKGCEKHSTMLAGIDSRVVRTNARESQKSEAPACWANSTSG